MFDIRVGYPSLDEEKKILLATTKGEIPDLKKVLSGKAIVNLQKLVDVGARFGIHGRLRDPAGRGRPGRPTRRRLSSSRTWSTTAPARVPART